NLQNNNITFFDPSVSDTVTITGDVFGRSVTVRADTAFINSGTVTGTGFLDIGSPNIINKATGTLTSHTNVVLQSFFTQGLIVTNNGLINSVDVNNGQIFIEPGNGADAFIGSGLGPVGTIQVPDTVAVGKGIHVTLSKVNAFDTNQ